MAPAPHCTSRINYPYHPRLTVGILPLGLSYLELVSSAPVQRAATLSQVLTLAAETLMLSV